MPLPWAMRGLRNGILTTRWPSRRDPYFDGFAGSVMVTPERIHPARLDELTEQSTLDVICPTGALQRSESSVSVDRGRCILCGLCVDAMPELFAWAPGSALGRTSRERLLVHAPAEDDAAIAVVRAELDRRVRRLRRSVHIRHVDAGSDGSDEWEVQALLNPVYDIHRLGIFFTASPRHADILLVTGVGASFMAAPLRRTRAAMPDPVVVIAVGTDATSGGLFASGYGGGRGVAELLDVDVWVPGSPASPFTLLHAILLALGRVRENADPVSSRGRLT